MVPTGTKVLPSRVNLVPDVFTYPVEVDVEAVVVLLVDALDVVVVVLVEAFEVVVVVEAPAVVDVVDTLVVAPVPGTH